LTSSEQVAHNFTAAFDSLLTAYERITEHLPILEQYDENFCPDWRVEKALEMVFRDIFEFHRRTLKYFKKTG
jgi:hypothetical protein